MGGNYVVTRAQTAKATHVNRQLLQNVLGYVESLTQDRAEQPDSALLAQYLSSHDNQAFATLIRRHGPMVWGLCRKLSSTDADAEDAFQATFLALVRGARQLREGDRLPAWLHGVAYRISMKVRRSAARRRHHETTAAPPEAVMPTSECAWGDLLAAVHEEVQRLPGKLKTAFVLCELEGVRQHDAADQLGLKLNTLTARLSRARQRLIENLSRRGIAPATAIGAIATSTATGSVPITLAAKVATFAHSVESISPHVLTLAQGALVMSIRIKWIAAVLLVAGSMTVGKLAIDANAQIPNPNVPVAGKPFAPPGNGPPPAGAPLLPPTGQTALWNFPNAPQSTHWEYKVQNIPVVNTASASAEMTKLGEDGWEFCELIAGNTSNPVMIFKRQKRVAIAGGSGMMGAGGMGGEASMGPSGGSAGGMPGGSGDAGAGGRSGAGRGATGGLAGLGKGATGGGGTPAPMPFNTEAKEPTAQVLTLKYAQAQELQTTLSTLLNARAEPGGFGGPPVNSSNRVKIASDARTNSLIVIADDATLKMVKELIEKLDVPDVSKERLGVPPPRGK